jgi:hypothetical protein
MSHLENLKRDFKTNQIFKRGDPLRKIMDSRHLLGMR